MTDFTASRAWKQVLWTWGSVIILMGLWALCAAELGAEVLLPSPGQTLKALVSLVRSSFFWRSLGATMIRGLEGFALSSLAGLVLGLAMGVSLPVNRLFQPILTVVRSTPVMSVIILALIWFGSAQVPVFVVFLIGFPIVTSSTSAGIRARDRKLTEMGRGFGLSKLQRLRHLVLPGIFPHLYTGLSSALGLTWKVAVAAEVLSQPTFALGTGLQEARIFLDTASVFAWTFVAIVLSSLSQGLLSLIFRRVGSYD